MSCSSKPWASTMMMMMMTADDDDDKNLLLDSLIKQAGPKLTIFMGFM